MTARGMGAPGSEYGYATEQARGDTAGEQARQAYLASGEESRRRLARPATRRRWRTRSSSRAGSTRTRGPIRAISYARGSWGSSRAPQPDTQRTLGAGRRRSDDGAAGAGVPRFRHQSVRHRRGGEPSLRQQDGGVPEQAVWHVRPAGAGSVADQSVPRRCRRSNWQPMGK